MCVCDKRMIGCYDRSVKRATEFYRIPMLNIDHACSIRLLFRRQTLVLQARCQPKQCGNPRFGNANDSLSNTPFYFAIPAQPRHSATSRPSQHRSKAFLGPCSRLPIASPNNARPRSAPPPISPVGRVIGMHFVGSGLPARSALPPRAWRMLSIPA